MPSATSAVSQERFRVSLLRAMATATVPEAGAAKETARASQEPGAPQGRDPRGCSCGLPSWLKYSLIGVAAAGGGYALSQAMGHGGEHGRETAEGVKR
jgi:hypothetical protein